MHVADFNADAGVVTVRESKASRPRHVVLTHEGQRPFATLTAGKVGNDPIFTRRDGGADQLRIVLAEPVDKNDPKSVRKMRRIAEKLVECALNGEPWAMPGGRSNRRKSHRRDSD